MNAELLHQLRVRLEDRMAYADIRAEAFHLFVGLTAEEFDAAFLRVCRERVELLGHYGTKH